MLLIVSRLCGLPYDKLERIFSQFGKNYDFMSSFSLSEASWTSTIRIEFECLVPKYLRKTWSGNIYICEPGNGIVSHVDTHSPFSDIIAWLSLLSAIININTGNVPQGQNTTLLAEAQKNRIDIPYLLVICPTRTVSISFKQ
ncbi:unnamed protein product [Brugia timori]|uniref:Uncharacterized protein n=1 Tax=Brugia timori TaxID=42155 RepID=A0A3P7XAY3_9BILA|nr:unnamed protein product [Brugia timori]